MAWQTPKTNWQAADVVSKDDFNRIEGNIQHLQDTKETPEGAQAKANAALNSAKQYTDQKANTTLNSAKQYTDQVANMIKPVVGSYTGTDSDVNLNLGFMPKFVIILASAETSTDFDYIGILAFPGAYQQIALHWVSTFRIGRWIDFRSTGIEISTAFSVDGVKYNYIAFR